MLINSSFLSNFEFLLSFDEVSTGFVSFSGFDSTGFVSFSGFDFAKTQSGQYTFLQVKQENFQISFFFFFAFTAIIHISIF